MFKLEISIDLPRVKLSKARLSKLYASAKSSHLSEAISRGLGFQTHASLLAKLNDDSFRANVEGDAFVNFLMNRGIEAKPSDFYREMAKWALADVHDEHPSLTEFRFGKNSPGRLRSDGAFETSQDCNEVFVRDRLALLSDGAVDPFLASLALVQRIERTKTIRRTSSYRLKHIAKNFECTFPGGEALGPVYVSNGLLIAAALHDGFDYDAFDKGDYGPNASFNMSENSIDDWDAAIRVNGPFSFGRERALRRLKKRFGEGVLEGLLGSV